MTEKLTDMFGAVSRQMAATLADMESRQRLRRQRWADDTRHVLDEFHLDQRRNSGGLSLRYWVTLYFLEGMGDIAGQRLLAVYLPMLMTLQRIELDVAKVPGWALFPEDDIRLYTGNMTRVE